MPKTYPKDRFDDLPPDVERIGAHRAPRRKGGAWIWVAWCALATVVLVLAGVLWLSAINGSVDVKGDFAAGTATPTATATPTPTPVETVNPALNVIVLNGTTTNGLAASVAQKLTNAGWVKVTAANAQQTDITKTVVYYSNPANRGPALALAKVLPGATVAETQAYAQTGADLTVVVGSDLAG